MTKKVSRKERNISKALLSIALLSFFSLILIGSVLAADVAYIYKSKPMINQDVLSVFAEMNLSVETIQEKKMPASFAGYKFIYAGNERFTKTIPVYDYPSVVTTYYFGQKWGLTDRDGISKLAATSPLSVDKDGQIIQVYTQAKYNNRPISLPYFYLGELDKVPAMQQIAETYVGISPNFIDGDVISFAPAGVHLINGKNAKGNICFFGIVESKYWTAEAREMFKECVGMVTNICSQDSDCGNDTISNNYCIGSSVYQNTTQHSCINPGTSQSQCLTNVIVNSIQNCTTNQLCSNGMCLNVSCSQNSDCGINGFQNNFSCQNNSVFGDYVNFNCINPGTPQSYCNSTISIQMNKTCSNDQTCSNGNCINNITCYNNSQCGQNGFIGDKFCNSNTVYQNFATYTCNNPGTPQSSCSNITLPQPVIDCNEFTETCQNGTCVEITQNNHDVALTDLINSVANIKIEYPNGTDILDNPAVLNCNQIYKIYVNVTNKGSFYENVTINGSIDGQTFTYSPIINFAPGVSYIKYVPVNITTGSGTFNLTVNSIIPVDINPLDNIAKRLVIVSCPTCNIECNSKTECGTDGFTGNPVCQNGNVYQNFLTYNCNNPGQCSSSCSTTSNLILKQNCTQGQTCSNGVCVPINVTCSTDTECNDNNLYTFDQCNNPGTQSSYCSHTPVNCVTNNDCGLTGFTGTEFCSQNDVFKNFMNSTCINAGTPNSYCQIFVGPKLITDCGQGQCVDATCVMNITCSTNSQCGTNGFTGNPFCQGNSVFQNFLTYTCNNPGTLQSTCSSSTNAQLIQNCPQNQVCSNGQCVPVNIPCTFNSDCGQNAFTGNPFCQGNDIFQNFITYTCNNPGTVNSYCTSSTNPQLKQNCPQGQTCTGGVCVPVNIPCTTNSQCGTNGFTGNPFCQGNSVFQNFITYTCNNPGQQNSFCTNSVSAQLTQTCPQNQVCSNGQCVPVNIPCTFNSDCGTNAFVNGAFCSGNDVFKNFITYTCNNPGQQNSFCTNSTSSQIFTDCGDNYCGSFGADYCKSDSIYHNRTCHDKGCSSGNCFDNANTDEQLVQDCAQNQICTNGQCVPINIPCTFNSDCGQNGFTGNPFCSGDDVFQNFLTYTCNNPGQQNSFCTNSTNPQIKIDCNDFTQTCSNGQCINLTIICTLNSDCGINGFTGNPFCQGNSIFQNFLTWTCNNPGTPQSSCSSSISSQFNQSCTQNQVCTNGICVPLNITCSNDAQCDDLNTHTQDTCNNPGTPQSFCSHTPINCLNNSECGTNGATGGPFCQGNSVFQNFLTYTCNNPATVNSFCSNSVSAVFNQTCSQNQFCSNGQCVNQTVTCSQNIDCGINGPLGSPFCQGNSIFQNFINYVCNNPGSPQSFCSISVAPSINQTCSQNQVCNNGQCNNQTIICSNNLQCGTDGPTGNPFCQGNSVFQNFISYTCNNAGTPQSFCSNSVNAQFNQSCSQNQVCSNGICVPLNITCSNDAQCDDLNGHTQDTCNNPGTPQSFCSHTPITCLNNSECGINGATGSPFCQGNSVFQNFLTYTCNNPATINSFCSNSVSAVFNQSCTQNQVCTNGQCINQTIICFNNSQCDDLNGHTQDTCNNPGTPQSFCTHTPIVCLNNTDCGINTFTGNPFCQGNNVFQNFLTYICINPGTISSSCTITSAPVINQSCLQNQVCNNGQCNNQTIICSTNSQCGTNGFIDSLNLQDVALNKPATATKVGSGLSLAAAVDGNYNSWWGTGDYGPGSITIDLQNEYDAVSYKLTCGGVAGGNTGVIHFFNANNVEVFTKNYNCAGGNDPQLINAVINFIPGNFNPTIKVKSVKIDATSPAGGDFINVFEFELYANVNSNAFCNGNNIFGKFLTYTCNNPGTPQSFCSNSTADQLKQTCPILQSCFNAVCVPSKCSQASDCGQNRLLNKLFCQGSSVFDKMVIYTCNNPGAALSYCSTATNDQFKEICPNGKTCSGGACVTSTGGPVGNGSCTGSTSDQNSNVCLTGCPARCDGSDWFIGVPKGYSCSGSVTTTNDNVALENDPKATHVFGGTSGRLEPESPGGLATMNKFCQDYTGDSSAFAIYGRVHKYCGGGNNNFWWTGSSWQHQAYGAGKLNVQEITCATGCNLC